MSDAVHDGQQPAGGDDRTRVVSVPAASGGDAAGDMGGDASVLPVGSRLAEFEITALIGQGGFGTVYQARDHALERVVAIKEYLPVSLSRRSADGAVHPLSQRQRETFELGMRSFINEARLLARFDHPSLLKVYRFWQERGTAYMAMPFYRGPTLRQALAAIPGGADEAFLLHIVDDLTQALAVMHRANCYHRDIAPDNILLLEGSNRPVLLDFGAARRVISNKTQTITTILKPGYAPIEQYAEMPDTPQGAWTDIYALAAVLHVAVTGHTPPPSVARLLADGYAPLAADPQLRERFSARLLAAIDAGLAVRPKARPQSIAAFRQLLGLDEASTAAPAPASAATEQRTGPAIAPAAEKTGDAVQRGAGRRRAALAAVSVLLVLAVGWGWWMLRNSASPEGVAAPEAAASSAAAPDVAASDIAASEATAPGTAAPSAAAPGAVPDSAASDVAAPDTTASSEAASNIAVLGAAAPNTAAPEVAASGIAASSAAVPGIAASEGELAGSQASADQSPAAGEKTPPQAPASQTAEVQQPSSPPQAPASAQSLAALSQGAASQFSVNATPRRPVVRVGKGRLGFKVRSSRAGYVYVYLLSTDGKLSLLFPNPLDKYNRIKAGQTLVLPRASWPMVAGGPPGVNRFAVLVSKYERDFSGSGLRSDALFPQFSLPNPTALQAAPGGKPSPLLGKPVCASGAACRDIYGVGTFEITEQ